MSYSHLSTISHTVDSAGFVLVRGKRVLNVPGVMLKSTASYQSHCQRCARCNVTVPLRVVSEFEHAINARRYFHVPPADGGESLCGECKEQS